ncbi:MAG: M20/M25/M40 family metallo-hydrolase, partial [Lachnospiraceae bacterium]|nr:M20/M25/M40 family metallo-hydrolase [Lachnospiraceae bacterium]
TISPDADFPLIFLEKGRLGGNFRAKDQMNCHDTLKAGSENPDVTILSFHAGNASNAVPGRAKALVKGISAEEWRIFADHAAVDMGLVFEIEEADDAVSIGAAGDGAHASTPEHGTNALTGLLTLLMSVESIRRSYPALEGLCRCFPHGDFRGHAMGVDLEDPVSGKTSLALTVLHLEDGKAEGWFDLRGGIPATKENTTDVIRRYLDQAGWELDEKAALSEVHYVPQDSELVIKLMASYKKITGRDEAPLAIGGGTYVHEIDNGVAFGCADPNVDNRMHGPDEFMSIDQMLLSCEIFADAILSICG